MEHLITLFTHHNYILKLHQTAFPRLHYVMVKKNNVSHVGKVKLGDEIILNNVLCVLSFNLNLIYVIRLTQDYECLIFSQKYRVIQNLIT